MPIEIPVLIPMPDKTVLDLERIRFVEICGITYVSVDESYINELMRDPRDPRYILFPRMEIVPESPYPD